MRRRKNTRKRDWDYSGDGRYFVTVTALDRLPIFGEIADGVMRRNEIGEIVAGAWQWLPSRYSHVALDEWCIMPDHGDGPREFHESHPPE